MRQMYRIHPEDVMKSDPFIESLLSIALITIFGLLLALFRAFS